MPAMTEAHRLVCEAAGRTKMTLAEREEARRESSRATGRIRGLLCPMCNLCIGQMGESPERLRKAAEYLEEVKFLQ